MKLKTRTTASLAAASLAAAIGAMMIAGCQTNHAAFKSSDASDIAPVTGVDATNMADQLPTVTGGPARGRRSAALQPVAIFPGPAQAVAVAVSKQGRVFIGIPRWADPVKNTVVELVDGKLIAFPDEHTNAFDATDPADYPPDQHLIAAQAIVFDAKDRLWVLDPGGFNFASPLPHGPKLWAYDINTRRRVKAISFPNDVALKMTSLNDVRFDLNRGPEGTAYITDSGVGGIIVVDLASGQSWRRLDGDPSVLPTPGLVAKTEGQSFLMRKSTGEVDSPDFRSDGIALSPDGKTLYYTSVMSHEIFSVPTDLLADRGTDEQKLSAAVHLVAVKPSGNDGMICDAQGRIYTTDYQDNCIRRVDPATGQFETIVQDERLIWPDTLAFHGSDLYVTVDQLPRQAAYHFGKDTRQPPYVLFKMRVDGIEKP